MNWYKKAQNKIKLWLDDERDPTKSEIQRDFGARGDEIWVKTVEEAIDYIKSGNVIYISFDNDLGDGLKEGRHLATWIEEMAYNKKIPRMQWAVHSKNYPASIDIIMAMKNADKYWDNNELHKKAKFKKRFVGDCVTGLNNDLFREYIANDATELAQLIEYSSPITLSQFIDLCEIDSKLKNRIEKNKDIFKVGQYEDIIWLYDKKTDKHYFYI